MVCVSNCDSLSTPTSTSNVTPTSSYTPTTNITPTGTSGVTTSSGVVSSSPAAPIPTSTPPTPTTLPDFEYSSNRLKNNATIDKIQQDFENNYIKANNRLSAEGGAIYNGGTIGEIIDSNFKGNYAESFNYFAYGGAIYNSGVINKIENSIFIDNYARYGGAIYNNGTIGEIINTTFSENCSNSSGAALINEGKIDKIADSTFASNYVIDNYASGGAIHNAYKRTIGEIIDSTFSGNYVKSVDGYHVEGGAIYNSGTINTIDSIFFENKAEALGSDTNGPTGFAQGGAINNSNYIGSIKGEFTSNSVVAGHISEGGAIYNNGRIDKIIDSTFENNHASSIVGYSYGGAVRNSSGIAEIINSSFIGNYAESTKDIAQGGAIYSYTDLNITADNGIVEFKDNYTSSNGEIDDNAIYLGNKDATLKFNLKDYGKIYLADNVRGAQGYKVSITGDSTGIFYLQNDIYDANLTLGGFTLNTINNEIHNYNFNNLTIANDINMAVDVDLANSTMDRLTAASYGNHVGNINVVGMNILSDSNNEITQILFAETGLKDNVVYAGLELPNEGYQTSFYTPIYKYNAVYDNKDDGGYFVFTKGDKIYVPAPGGGNTDNNTGDSTGGTTGGDIIGGGTTGGGTISSGNSSDAFNPAVLGGATSAAVGAIGTINQTINNSFHSVDTFMNLPSFDRISIKNQNRYAFNMADDTMNLGRFSPLYQPQDEQVGIWIKPYATFENVPLKNGPKVNNIAYGTLVGFDTELKELSHGWDRVWTGYIGYNGASQHFTGVDSTQNGGLLGGTLTLYKGNFFNATTLNIGASVAENQTMYGTDNLTMLMSGIANKCGYNLEFKDGKFILQPNLVLGYSFVNTFDYTNAAGLKIDNKPLHYIQISPGVKFIGNLKNGWQPYASVSMMWNLMGESNSTANGVKLPEMSIKPYVQYGVGVQKRIKDNFTAYGQAMIQNGGRNGVSLSAGFKWAIGKKK